MTPLHLSPEPLPKRKRSSVQASCSAPRAGQWLSQTPPAASQAERAQAQAQALPPPLPRLSAQARPRLASTGPPGGEGAATASPRTLLVPQPGAVVAGGSSGRKARPGPLGQRGEHTQERAAQLPFPPRGSPSSSRPRRLPGAILYAAAATHTIVGRDLAGTARDPPHFRPLASIPLLPATQQSYLCLPTNCRIPFAPHTGLALSLQSRRRKSHRLHRARTHARLPSPASPRLHWAPAYCPLRA
jgi:hypothetical protein